MKFGTSERGEETAAQTIVEFPERVNSKCIKAECTNIFAYLIQTKLVICVRRSRLQKVGNAADHVHSSVPLATRIGAGGRPARRQPATSDSLATAFSRRRCLNDASISPGSSTTRRGPAPICLPFLPLLIRLPLEFGIGCVIAAPPFRRLRSQHSSPLDFAEKDLWRNVA